MKLTPENRKALEESIEAGYSKTINEAAALLLEIWEPLAEMVEARGKVHCGEVSFREYENYPNGYAVYETEPACNNFCVAEKWEERATADRIGNLKSFGKLTVSAANNLAAIRKAVG